MLSMSRVKPPWGRARRRRGRGGSSGGTCSASVRRRAEEHRGVAEDLAQPVVDELASDEASRAARAAAARAVPVRESTSPRMSGRMSSKLVYRKRSFGEFVGVRAPSRGTARGVRRRRARCSRTARGCPRSPRQISSGLVDALEVHAVAGVERHQRQLLFGGRAQQLEEVVEDLGHEVPRRARVEPEAVATPSSQHGRRLGPPFEQGDVVAFAREQRGTREARDAAADDDDLASRLCPAKAAGERESRLHRIRARARERAPGVGRRLCAAARRARRRVIVRARPRDGSTRATRARPRRKPRGRHRCRRGAAACRLR